MKSRGVYETPGVTLLHHAHRAVESITLDREVQHLRDELSRATPRWSTTASGSAPSARRCSSFMDSVQERVNGEARLKLYKGNVVGRGSPVRDPHALRRGSRHLRGRRRLRPVRRHRVHPAAAPCGCAPSAASGSRRANEPAARSASTATRTNCSAPSRHRLEIDLWIADEDIDGSIAHVTMLGEVGMLSSDEAKPWSPASIGFARRSGTAPGPRTTHEDIHMAVEARLIEIVGEVGGKLHTARSRNDQVATDVRLWLKRRLDDLDGAPSATRRRALLDRVESDGQVADTGLHPPAARPADPARAPPAGPRLGAEPRPRAFVA